VVATAVVGAGAVAWGTGVAAPVSPDQGQGLAPLSLASSNEAASKASRGFSREDRAVRTSRSLKRAGAPEPKLLPDWLKPALGPISSLFAARWGTFHYGVDIAAPYGSTVRAASAGKIIRAGWYGGYGNVVIIDHGNGLTSRYGHNSKVLVHEGETVQAGDPIAQVGSTGWSTGNHCHFELRQDDKPFDPMPFMKEHGALMGLVDTAL
jgi:murein DD-endopeptidase MepM/ murein hydrolase activator NlpD